MNIDLFMLAVLIGAGAFVMCCMGVVVWVAHRVLGETVRVAEVVKNTKGGDVSTSGIDRQLMGLMVDGDGATARSNALRFLQKDILEHEKRLAELAVDRTYEADRRRDVREVNKKIISFVSLAELELNRVSRMKGEAWVCMDGLAPPFIVADGDLISEDVWWDEGVFVVKGDEVYQRVSGSWVDYRSGLPVSI